ncbi:autotransporter outer membrane beta-barrel domain-containing protein [Rhodovastum atsumiense]|uniref:Autotransporter domain-containing protein n=1 Tax=Rhodovastum atsumiense TaxID=504468 RepID=A0A5M6IZX1_9PROT|nr:autotransporter outer membrane beta-barrel domain-containing protein [Rhodovastum atsumiense]KAA5613882.1 autotransporter domain-containing protein [Rhodovastum atsumiense]
MRTNLNLGIYLQNFTLDGSSTNTIDQYGKNTLFTGVFSDARNGTPGNITFANSQDGGSTTLAGINTYTGRTTIDSGATLILLGLGSIASSSDVVDNGTLDISLTLMGTSIRSLSGNGSVDLGWQRLTLSDASGTFDGSISGHGGLTVAGGTETLSSTNTYTGRTTIDNGATLALSGSGSIAASSRVVANGRFDISATDNGASIRSLSGNGAVALGTQTLTLSNAWGRFGGDIGGSGGLTVAGGTETLTGTNSYTGLTTIESGARLALAGHGSIAASSGVVDNGNFDISRTRHGASISSLSGSGTVSLGRRTLTLSDASGTFSGGIGGRGGLTVAGGTETLSGTNTYTGRTAIDAGATLALSGSGSIAASSEVAANGTFDISATSDGASIRTLSGNGSVALGAQTLTLSNASGTFDGGIDGSGGLSVAGGTATLTGTNTYSGQTGIGSGATLALSGGGSIAASSEVVDNGTFDISATSNGASIRSLSGGGAVALGVQTLTLSDAGGTFVGAIDGSGGLTVAGGTEILTGTNTYTGQTGIGAGATLALSGIGSIAASSEVVANGRFDISATDNGTSIRSLSGSGGIDLGAQTLTLSNAAGTFSGSIDGSSGMSVTGGTETLTGTSTYTGQTGIGTGATLALSGLGSIAASSGVIDNGIFDISATTRGATIRSLAGGGTVTLGAQTLTLSDAGGTFSGSIGGSGGVTVTGGTETLTGTSTYTGLTTINPGATLALTGSGSIAASEGVLDNGVFDISATSNGATIRTLAGTGTVNLGAQKLTLTGAADHFTGTIAGGGALVLAAGTEVLNGVVSGTMDMTIDAGSLFFNNGTIAAASLIVDGTLRGTGLIRTPTTVNGVLAPGNSPGTMSFTAPLTLTAGSVTTFDIDGTGTSNGAGNYSRIVSTDSVTVGGTLQPVLRGITGSASNSFVPVLGQQFQVITAAGGVQGSYGGMAPANGATDGLPAGTRFDALYAPTTLTLVVTPASYGNLSLAGLPETGNQQAVGSALDALRPAAGVRMDADAARLFYPLYTLSGPAIAPAFEQLSPTIYGYGMLTARDTWYDVAATVGDQLAARRAGDSAGANTAQTRSGLTFWATGLGRFTDISGSGAPSAHSSVGGMVAGVDYAVAPDTVIGFAAGGSHASTRSNGASIDGDAVNLSVYGGHRSGLFFVDGQAAYMHADQDATRNLSAWGQGVRGSRDVDGGGVQVDAGLALTADAWRIEPTVGFSALSLSGGALQERGTAPLAERIDGQSLTSLQSLVGVRFGTSFAVTPTMPLRVQGLVGWQHEYGTAIPRGTAALTLASTAPFSYATTSVGRDTARIGAGMDMQITQAVGIYASYRAGFAQNATSQNITGGLRVTW